MTTPEDASPGTGHTDWQEPSAAPDLGTSPWATPGDTPPAAAAGHGKTADHVNASGSGDDAAEIHSAVPEPVMTDATLPPAPETGEAATVNDERVPDPEPEPEVIAETKPDPAVSPDVSALLATQLTALHELVESRFKIYQHKEKIIDRLHEELQSYKDDLLTQLLKPVLNDLLRLHDDLSKILRDLREKPPEDIQSVVHSLSSFPDDILDILSRQGLEAYHAEPDSSFDPKIQSVIAKVPTADSSRDKGIAESVRPGFLWGERVFRRNMVRIHVFQNPQLSQPAGTTTS